MRLSRRRPRLLAIDPTDEQGREVRLARDEVTIGSDEGNQLHLGETGVSRRHAVIRYVKGRYVIRDLRSTNGTSVNGHKIKSLTVLKDGDHIEFGGVRYVFLDPKLDRGRRKFSLSLVLSSIVGLFAVAFGLTEFFINRTFVEQTQSRPTAAATVELKATHPSSTTAPSKKEATSPIAAIPAASPRAQPTRASAALPSDWLGRLNYYRVLAGLRPVTDDRALDNGCRLHAQYLIKTLKTGGIKGGAAHTEDPSSPWYTREGLTAARHSDISFDSYLAGGKPYWAIDNLMSIAWHRLWILNPGLRAVGYGDACDGASCAGVLDLSRADAPPSVASPLSQPIKFPPDASTIPLRLSGGEWPDPLIACSGYQVPAGLPMTLQLGARVPIRIVSYKFELNKCGDTQGTSRIPAILQSCAIDASIYANPVRSEQNLVRSILNYLGAMVIVPRDPLEPGCEYVVSVATSSKSFTWSFTVDAQDSQELPAIRDSSLPPATHLPLESESKVRSLEGNQPAQLYLVNRTSDSYRVYWLDYDGKRRDYGALGPHERKELDTFISHPWLVCDNGNRPVALFVADKAKSIAILP